MQARFKEQQSVSSQIFPNGPENKRF